MPGNLEAPQILCEHVYGVKRYLAENPYRTRVSEQAVDAGRVDGGFAESAPPTRRAPRPDRCAARRRVLDPDERR
jgi:hypothetical protein